MYLLIDTISDVSTVILFDENRTIIDKISWEGKYQEFSHLGESIKNLLGAQNLAHKDVAGIVVLIGPGGFTGTRIATLVANSIGFACKTDLFELNYFDFLEKMEAPYPFLISANKRESLIKTTYKDKPLLKENSDIPEGEYRGVGRDIDFKGRNVTIHTADGYEACLKNLDLSEPKSRTKPIYIKDPNIILKQY